MRNRTGNRTRRVASRRPTHNRNTVKNSHYRRPVRRRRKNNRAIFRLCLLSILLIGFVVGLVIIGKYLRSPIVRTAVKSYCTGELKVSNAFPGKEEVTLLFLGKDADHDNHGRVLKTRGRTDAILLTKLDFTKKTVNILSIPRDTKVEIPGRSGHHKINAAHAYGGPELTVKTIEEFLGVKPEAYVVIDFTSFEKAIDNLGGFEVSVAKQMDYDDNWGNLHIHLKPGKQVLNGNQALGFVRFRKSKSGYAETDKDRIARQQELLFAIKQKLVSPKTFYLLPDAIDTVKSGVNSSLSDNQLLAIANFMRSIPKGSVHMETLPSTLGRVYVTANQPETDELVRKMFN